MSPEKKLADFARRTNLQDKDVDYLLTLLQEARGLGSFAGAIAEREACALEAEKKEHGNNVLFDESDYQGAIRAQRTIAAAIRARG